MIPVLEDMDILMAWRVRQRADDMIRQQKIVDRFNTISDDYSKVRDYIELCLSPLSVCLLELMSI